jgi:hypothetical protein
VIDEIRRSLDGATALEIARAYLGHRARRTSVEALTMTGLGIAARLCGEGAVEPKVVDRALSDAGTLEDTKLASLRTQSDIARMHFITACRSHSQAEKDFFHPLWRREEDRMLGGLLYRSMELMGANRIIEEDGTVLAALPIYPDVQKASVRKNPSRRARRAAAAERKSAP